MCSRLLFYFYFISDNTISRNIYLGYFLSLVFIINYLLPMIIGEFVLGIIAIFDIKRLNVALADDMPKIAKVIK